MLSKSKYLRRAEEKTADEARCRFVRGGKLEAELTRLRGFLLTPMARGWLRGAAPQMANSSHSASQPARLWV